MESLGQILRRERERRGLSIEELAGQTRINPAYFRAIEAGDRKSLPGGFFYRSFIRQYARLLELPESVYEQEIARSLQEESQAPPVTLPERHIDVPPLPAGVTDRAAETRRWLLRLAGLVAVVALSTMLYAVYLRWRTPAEVVQTDAAAPPIAMPASAEPEPTPAPAAALPDAAPQSVPPAAPSAEPATVQPETAPASAGAVRVRLAAREAVWVEVWADGRRVFNNLMNAADSRSFDAQARIRVLLGNAGGMDFEWNGAAVAPVGPRGQVRTVEFGTDSYQLITPAPAAPAPAAEPKTPASA